ncbi:MAG: copper amine oxidase N-terminal domain-containing protein [Bacillota bacterium]
MRRKALVVILLMTLLVVAFIPAYAAYDYNVVVLVNGTSIYFPDQKPFVDAKVGRTYVPLRFVSQALGCKVDWDDATDSAVILRNGTTVVVPVGSKQILINGAPQAIDAPAFLLNGRTMVPLRFVSEALNAKVEWKPGRPNQAVITDPLAPGQDPEPVQRVEAALGVDMIPLKGAYRGRWVYDPANIYQDGKFVGINYEWLDQNNKMSYPRVVYESTDNQVQVGIQWDTILGDIRGVVVDLSPVEKVLQAFFPGRDAEIAKVMEKAREVARIRQESNGFTAVEPVNFKVGGKTVTVDGRKDWWEGNNFVVVTINL